MKRRRMSARNGSLSSPAQSPLPDMISICTTVKNRSRIVVDGRELRLFPNCLKSIVASVGWDIRCELVVADWNSDDWPLELWLATAAKPVPVRIIAMERSFSKGRGLNAAARAAVGGVLCFVDTDALICRRLFTSGLRYLRTGRAYFPILYAFDDAEHRTGKWRHRGYGHCMVTKAMYDRAGGWPEYESWGQEDDDFFAKISSFNEVIREEVPGFYHQWHPDDIYWKNRYYSEEPLVMNDMRRAQVAARELEGIIAKGQTFILVDECWLPTEDLRDREPLPFLERDGQYWGLPPDDKEAIVELERMRDFGAAFFVFLWPAFWWFDYYAGLHRYLSSNFPCLLENERLLVFKLQP